MHIDRNMNMQILHFTEDDTHAMGYRENAKCQYGVYWIENHEDTGEWRVYFDGEPYDMFICGANDIDSAKRFAQEHFDERTHNIEMQND